MTEQRPPPDNTTPGDGSSRVSSSRVSSSSVTSRGGQGPASARGDKQGASGLPSGLAFFMEEWGLLLLAGIVTFGSWWIVREQVVKAHRIDGIRVVLVVDESVSNQCDAILTDKKPISIVLNCSEREKNEAINALQRTGVRAVTLRVRDAPRGEYRSFTGGLDVFEWPFDFQRILDPDFLPPDVRVFKIEPTKVHVVEPKTVGSPEELRDQGLQVKIEVQQPTRQIAVPTEAFDVPLSADPVEIDPTEFPTREDGSYESERLITLTFGKWRETPDEPWLLAYRRQLKLPEIKALVTVTRIGVSTLQHTLIVLADTSKYEFDLPSVAEESDGKIQATSARLTFTDTLRGPKSVLTELAEKKNLWTWGVRLKKDPAEEFAKDPEAKTLPLAAEIVWIPYDYFQNRGIVHEKGAFELEFTVSVTKRETK